MLTMLNLVPFRGGSANRHFQKILSPVRNGAALKSSQETRQLCVTYCSIPVGTWPHLNLNILSL